jgi:murein DD-endopeptidase MepM/ murein hydrolase activator NlpD
MIAVLRRQLIDKRTPRAVRIRTASPPVFTLRHDYSAGPPQHVAGRRKRDRARPRLLDVQRPARGKTAGSLPGAASRRIGFRGPIRFLVRLASNPLFTILLAAALFSVIFIPLFLVNTHSIRTSLPSSPDADEELSRIFIPEEAEATGSDSLSQAVLKSLKVGSYTVRRGDTLSQIAQSLRLDIGTLISFNGIRDARSLSAGAVLKVPNSNGLSYKVRRGDSLEKIARSFSVPLETILDFNSLTSSIIRAGQELFIPGAKMSTAEINKVLGNMFIYPVSGRITSRFGDRNDPFTGVVRAHNGIDIANNTGTPIAAAMAGDVASAGFNANYGNYVIIKHTGTVYQTLYGHLSKILVSRGQTVRQGQTIGLLGNTGYSTGPHLHFSVFKNGEAVDPLKYLK